MVVIGAESSGVSCRAGALRQLEDATRQRDVTKPPGAKPQVIE